MSPPDVADLVGVAFARGGRNPHRGLDCWGLARLVLGRMGVVLPAYGEVWWGSDADQAAVEATMAGELAARWREVPGDERWTAGDILVLRVAGQPVHVGVVLEWPDFIHACPVAGAVVVERATSVRWRNRVVACHRPQLLEVAA